MKAVLYHRHGPPEVLQYQEIDKPIPGNEEVLIKVHAAALNPLDWRMMRAPEFLIRILAAVMKFKITRPGVDVAGVVESVGSNVTQFKPGDAVFGTCDGAFAEYACTPESQLAPKPQNLTFEQAASAPVAAFTALQGLRDKGHVQPGQRVLVNGAAGGVGTFTVQIARWFGAEVTGVCSARNLDLVRSIGAAHVIDYAREDFTKSAEKYDVIFDLIANHPVSDCRRIMSLHGIYIGAGASKIGFFSMLRGLFMTLVVTHFSTRKIVSFMAKFRQDDLLLITNLMATGKITPVIDRTYTLAEVPDAIRYLETGHARGKVVVTV